MTSISQERAALKRAGRPLRTREQAGFRFSRYGVANSVTEPAPLVFVHITITNPKSYSSDDAHARAVEAIGISRFPNTGISYNRLVMQSGKAYEGQPMGRQGAHTVNNKGITRCASSGCPSRGAAIPPASVNLNDRVRAYAICQNVNDTVSTGQLDSLARTIAADILAGLVTRAAQIHGHRCVAPKDCPGGKMWALMLKLESLVHHYVSTGLGGSTTPTDPAPLPVKEWDEMATKAEVEAAVYAGNVRYGKDFWTATTGTGTALIKAVGANGAAIAALAQFVKADDAADDAAFAAAMAEIATANEELKAAVEALAAEVVEPPKA